MTKEELDFIGAMNMCDEISNEAYKKIMCHCEEQEECEDCISRQAVLDHKEIIYNDEGVGYQVVKVKYIHNLPFVKPQEKTGHWELDETDNSIVCDKCGCRIWANDIFRGEAHYCPNCGSYNGGDRDGK